MKIIATAAVLMMLVAPAWADEPEKQTNDPAKSNDSILLSEAEMDGVTAGGDGKVMVVELADVTRINTDASTKSKLNLYQTDLKISFILE